MTFHHGERPNCDDCGHPMAAEWDTSSPREPKLVGWRCQRIHPSGVKCATASSATGLWKA